MDKHDLRVRDPWEDLKRYTDARIAMGRCGVSLPTRHHLDFQLAHARARDAVHHSLDGDEVQLAFESLGMTVIRLRSAAESRATYLQRPDLGRKLLAEDARTLSAMVENLQPAPAEGHRFDLVLVVADGLCAQAVEASATELIRELLPMANEAGWRLAPLALVEQGRVAIGDEIGGTLGAEVVAVLIGERPGLSSPDSLGIYLTYAPCPGLTDERRNCISNVRPAGLLPALAAEKLFYLVAEARRRKLSGVELKDELPQLQENLILPG